MTFAVMGAGAVGCYFGGMLARAGRRVTLIGRPHHVEAIARDGLFIDSVHFQERVAVTATTDPSAAAGADAILLCVKATDTEEAARALAPHAGNAALLCLQNGMDNAERVTRATGIEAIPAAVYVGAEMTGPGRVRHSGRGDLILPLERGDRAAPGAGSIERIASELEAAGVPCRLSIDIRADLWIKLVMNCAYNAISALTGARYGRIAADPATIAIMTEVARECFAVARAEGVALDEEKILEAARTLGERMVNALSSTAQDIARGKPTEIDALNGYVVRRGAELGVPAPVNEILRALVKLLEGSTRV